MRSTESMADAPVDMTLSDFIYHFCMGLISFAAVLMTRSSILNPVNLQNPVFLFFGLLSFYYLVQYTIHQLRTAYSAGLINYKMCLGDAKNFNSQRMMLFLLKTSFLILSNAALLGLTAVIITSTHISQTAAIIYFASYQAVTMLRNYFSHSTAFDFVDTYFHITSTHAPSEKLLFCSRQPNDTSLWNTVYHNIDGDLLADHHLTCQLNEALKPHRVDHQKEPTILFQPMLLTNKATGKTLWVEYDEARHHVNHLFNDYDIAPFTDMRTQQKIRDVRSFVDKLTDRLRRVDQFQSSLRVITQSSDFKNYTQALSSADVHQPSPSVPYNPYTSPMESSDSSELVNLLNAQRDKLSSLAESAHLPTIRRNDVRLITEILSDSSRTLDQKTHHQLTTLAQTIPCMTLNNPFALLIHLFPDNCMDSLNILLSDHQLKNRLTAADFFDTLVDLNPEIISGHDMPHPSKPADALSAFFKKHNLETIHDIVINHAACRSLHSWQSFNNKRTSHPTRDSQQCAVTGEPISIPILVTLTQQQGGSGPITESFHCDLYGLSCWLDSDPSSHSVSPQLSDDTRHINQILKDKSSPIGTSVKSQLEGVLAQMASRASNNNPLALLIHHHREHCFDALNILLQNENLKKRIHSSDLLRTLQSFDKVEMQTVRGQQIPAPPKKISLAEYLIERNLTAVYDLIVEKCYEDADAFMSSNGYQRTTHGPEILLKKRWPFKRNFLLDTDLEVSMHLDLDVLDDNHQRTITIIEQIITPQASAIKAQLSPDKTYFVNSDNANSHFFGKDLTPSDLARYSLYNEKTCICETPLSRQPMGTGMFFQPLKETRTDNVAQALFRSPGP